jgi:4-hydroxybenzoate polyprenyltransferase
VALRLALAMFLIQASIGAVNDIVDESLDRGQKIGKPLPAGLISGRLARAWAAFTGALGLALAASSGQATFAVAAVGLGLGYLYDLRLSRTVLSWLPLTLALPLLPIYAWLGATGAIPPGLLTLVPAALLAGFALTVGNGLVDIERDALAGRPTIAVRIGRGRAWPAHATAFLVAIAIATLLAPGASAGVSPDASPGALPGGSTASGIELLRVARWAGIPIGAVAVVIGVGLLVAQRASVRERGWELEVIGTATLGLGWLAGTAATFGGGVGT